ncbi:hypothetical protein QE152_g24996 [Popillia japonica]|uniref:CCC domain-containing protein n=1 Tax=Popillia japonica TaxID=7064 RepID=A0AAW1K2Z3_POPJA
MKKSTLILFSTVCVILIFEATNGLFLSQQSTFDNLLRRRCPLCDSSVYGYCSDKLFHDSCCCRNTNNPYDKYPYECQYADCNFLHANSCYEHKLISACCCTNYLY